MRKMILYIALRVKAHGSSIRKVAYLKIARLGAKHGMPKARRGICCYIKHTPVTIRVPIAFLVGSPKILFNDREREERNEHIAAEKQQPVLTSIPHSVLKKKAVKTGDILPRPNQPNRRWKEEQHAK